MTVDERLEAMAEKTNLLSQAVDENCWNIEENGYNIARDDDRIRAFLHLPENREPLPAEVEDKGDSDSR